MEKMQFSGCNKYVNLPFIVIIIINLPFYGCDYDILRKTICIYKISVYLSTIKEMFFCLHGLGF